MLERQTVDRRTHQLEHTFNNAIGAGVRSIVNAKGRTYFILKHLTTSGAFAANKEQEVLIDYIELGRDPKCQIRYDEGQKFVARRHAAILKEGTNWVLRNLSRNNPTLLNGRPVTVQWYLNTGDEIQLSMEGPRLRFIIPQNNSVAAIPLTRRVNLVMDQALRPYRRIIYGLALLLVLAIAGFSWWSWQLKMDNEKLKVENDQIEQNLVAAVEETKRTNLKVDSITTDLTKSVQRTNLLKKQMNSMRDMMRRSQDMNALRAAQSPSNNSGTQPTQQPVPEVSQAALLEALHPSIYYLRLGKITTKLEGETKIFEYELSGTGFLLSDGRFVTSRHLVQPWSYFNPAAPDAAMILLNMVHNNGGRVNAEIIAYSPDGSKLSFSTSDFTIDDSGDETISVVDPESKVDRNVRIGKINDGKDWATIKTTRTGVIAAAPTMAESLPAATKIYTLGYTYGHGALDPGNIKPLYGYSEISKAGLENGMILVTNRNFDHGNSGGPALYLNNNGQFVAVGIISTLQGSIGGIVPISHIR